MQFMFDNNAFDKAIENIEFMEELAGKHEFFMTYVQEQELKAMPDWKKEKFEKIFKMINDIGMEKVPTSVFLLNDTPIGSGKLGSGEVYDELLNEGKGNRNDALIGATAVEEGYNLVTNDKQLYNKMLKYNVKVMTFEEFMEQETGKIPPANR